MLKKQYRLRSNNGFHNVYTHGKRHYYGGVLLYYAPNGLTHCRMGCVVGKKYSLSSVKRNAQRRILLQVCAEIMPLLIDHYDIVVIYTNHNNMLPYKKALHTMLALVKKNRLVK